MQNEHRFTNQLTDYLGSQDMYLAVSTYINGEGNRVATKKKSSFGGQVLKYLNSSKREQALTTEPRHFSNPFYAENIFLNSEMQSVEQLGEHDSTKWKNSSYATIYKRESKKDWLERNFVFQYLGAMSSNSYQKYYQQVYTTSDKGKIRVAKVRTISEDNIDDYLMSLIKQEQKRDYEKTEREQEAFSALKNYTPLRSYLAGNRGNKIPSNKKEEEQALANMKEALKAMASDFVDEINKRGVYLSDDITSIYEKVTGEKPSKAASKVFEALKSDNRLDKALEQESLTRDDYEKASEEVRDQIREIMSDFYKENKDELNKILLPVALNFVHNWYVNSHQLNQLVTGDQAHFKTGSETNNMIKRMSIAFGPGSQGKVGNKFMKPKFRVAVLEDQVDLMRALDQVRLENVGSEFETTDAQGYVLPSYQRQLQKGHGSNAKVGNVLKPVYYGFDEYGIPRAIKFSATVLTDELVEQFPALAKLRKMMEETLDGDGNPVDMVTFDSAIKVGKLKTENMSTLYKRDEEGERVGFVNEFGVPSTINPSSVLTLNNAELRIQLNPDKDPLAVIANPTQLPYLTVINPDISDLAQQLLEHTADRMSRGARMFDKKYGLDQGNPTNRTAQLLMDSMERVMGRTENSSNEAYIMGVDNVSINIPILTDKLISTLSSDLSKSTSNFRIKGGKLVLQSAFGTDIIGFDQDGKAIEDELAWRTKEGYTEVYVTEELLTQYGLKVGDTIADKALAAVGFRIPSTGLHSAIVMKIKGAYKTDPGKSPNIIIAPKEIVDIHGSDYDVDSLMFITRNRWQDALGDGIHDLNEQFSLIYDEHEYDPNLEKYPLDIINYKTFEKTDTDLVSDKEFIDKIKEAVEFALTKREEIFNSLNFAENPNVREILAPYNKAIAMFDNILALSAENNIVDTYVKILTHASSRQYMELPITMNYLKSNMLSKGLSPSSLDIVAMNRGAGYPLVNGNRDFTKKFSLELFNKDRDSVLYGEKDASNIMDHLNIHYDTFSGASLTGISANSAKVLAYLVMAAKGDRPLLREGLEILINGGTYNKIEQYEMEQGPDGLTPIQHVRTKKEEGITSPYTIWESIDALINSSIDNVNEGINVLINLNGRTANPYFAGIGLGIPMNTMTKLMTQGAIMDLSQDSEKVTKKYLGQLRAQYIQSYLEAVPGTENLNQEQKQGEIDRLKQLVELTDEELDSAAKEYNGRGELVSEEALLIQIKTLNTFMKLFVIGESLFEASEVALLIRAVPNKYGEAKDLLRTVLYKMTKIDEELGKVEDVLFDEVEKDNYDTHDDWPFVNANLLNLPHMQEGVRSTQRYVQMCEKLVWKHSDQMNDFVEGLTRKYWGKTTTSQVDKEQFKTDFITYMNAGMSINLFGKEVDMSIPNLSLLDNKGNELHGFRAFTYRLIQELKKYNRDNDNAFASRTLHNYNGYNKQWSILFTAHKNLDLAGMHEMRLAFQALPKDLQTKLFKYLLLTRGISFGATSYAEILPDNIISAYSAALTNSLPEDIEDLKKHLNTFALQFARNNPSSVQRFTSKDSAVIKKDGLIEGRGSVQIEGSSRPIIYDLALKGNTPGIIQFKDRTYGMYVKIEHDKSEPQEGEDQEEAVSYYRKVGKINYSKQYIRSRSNDSFADFKMSRVITPNTIILSSLGVRDNKFNYSGNHKITEGQFVFLRNPQDGGLENMKKYKVSEVTLAENDKKEKVQVLTLESLYSVVPYTKEEASPSGKGIHKPSTQNQALQNKTPIFQIKTQIFKEVIYYSVLLTDLEKLTKIKMEDRDFQAIQEVREKIAEQRKEIRRLTLEEAREKTKENIIQEHSDTMPERVIDSMVNKDKDFTEVSLSELMESHDEVMTEEQRSILEALRKLDNSNIFLVRNIWSDEHVQKIAGLSSSANTFLALDGKGGTDFVNLLIHELMHRHTEKYTSGRYTTEELAALSSEDKAQIARAINQMKDLLDTLRKHPDFQSEDWYGLSNVDELMAEAYGNPEFRNLLKRTVVPGVKNTKRKTLWQQLIEFLSILWNGLSSSTIDESTAYDIIEERVNTLVHYGTAPSSDLPFERMSREGLNKKELEEEVNKGNRVTPDSYMEYILSDEFLLDLRSNFPTQSRFKPKLQTEEETGSVVDRLQEQLLKEVPVLTADENNYTDESKVLYERLSTWVQKNFAPYSSDANSAAEFFANKDFESRNLNKETGTYKVVSNGQTLEYSYADRVKYHESDTNLFRAFGKLAHALIERHLTSDPVRIQELSEQIAGYYKGTEDTPAIGKYEMKWLEDNIDDIIDKSGIHFDSTISPSDMSYKFLDKVLPELAVTFKEIGIGTTIDGLVEHKDGSVSIIDWKTQRLLNDQGRTDYMTWGATYGIRNTKLDKAKLEVVIRAMTIKARFPETQFNILSINWLNKRHKVRVFHIDLVPYLGMISDMLKKDDPETYKELNDKGLFNEENYYREFVPDREVKSILPTLTEDTPVEQALEVIDTKLESIYAQYTSGDIANNDYIKKQVKLLIKQRAGYVLGTSYDPDSKDEDDLNRITKGLLNLKDSRHKMVQMFNKQFFAARDKAAAGKQKDWDEHDEKYKPVVIEYFRRKGAGALADKLINAPLNAIPFGSVNSRELNMFMWRHFDEEGRKGYYANMEDTYIPEGGGNPIPLTKAQKEYRDFYHSRIKERYDELYNQQLVNEKGVRVSKGKFQDLPVLDENFMPRIAPEKQDIKAKYGFISNFVKRQEELFKFSMTNYVVDNYQGDSSKGIPVRYAMQEGSPVIANEDHSLNAAQAFKLFIGNIHAKKNLDSSYALGQSVQVFASTALTKEGKSKYQYLTAWLEDMMSLHILNDTDDGDFHYRE